MTAFLHGQIKISIFSKKVYSKKQSIVPQSLKGTKQGFASLTDITES